MGEYKILIYLFVFLVALFALVTTRLFGGTIKPSSQKKGERIKTLEAQGKIKDETGPNKTAIGMIDKYVNPVSDVLSNYIRPKNEIKMKRMLKVAGWSDYFNPDQWRAFVFMFGALGVVLGTLAFTQSKLFGALLWGFFIILPSFLLRNSYNNRNEDLLMKFPETIRIMAGYLSSGMILPKAVAETAKGASPVWHEILDGFAVKCETEGISEAIAWMKEEVDIMEGREFFATIKLTVDLGGSVRDGFVEQADLIQELLRNAMQKKIEKRKTYATVVQAPIFLCIIGAFALPLLGTFKDLF